MENQVRNGLFFTLVALTTTAFIGLIGEFLIAVFWAIVLTLIFFNFNRRVRIKLRGRDNAAAALTTVFILLVVMIPLLSIATAIVDQSLHLYQRLSDGELNFNFLIDTLGQQLPILERYLGDVGIDTEALRENVSNFALTATQVVANQALSYGSNLLTFVIQFTLMLYLLFFFLRDGRRIMAHIINTVPLGNRRERHLFKRFAAVSRATIKGTLTVAMVQGGIGGVLFAILGIPGALLWGVAMTFLSLLPVGGSAIVWFPAAVILFVQGAYTKAIILLVAGTLIIGLIDNLLRPLLVGRDTEMPDYLVLLSTLGGLTWFGLTGFVLGPIIAALFITIWEMVGLEYGGRDD
jgi:predicted PurR-regulated permease PerM